MWQQFREYIKQQFKLNLTDKHISQFKIYLKELIDCSEKFNLTSIIEPEKILYLHFADSLAGSVLISPKSNVADIGSGAGFPGVPLKIVHPEIQLTVFESQKKKALFIDYIKRKLQLKNIEILNCRAEDQKEYQSKFDFVLFRAVSSNIVNCMNLAAKLLKERSGMAIYWQSKYDISKFESLLPDCKVIQPYFEYTLPIENRLRYLISIKKIFLYYLDKEKIIL